MGSARWHCSGIVAAPADVVYSWLTDFSPDDHNSEAYKRGAGVRPKKGRKGKVPREPEPAVRTILAREGNVLKIRDQWDGNDWTQTVTLDPATRSYRVDGKFGYEAHWRAISEGNATRVEFEGKLGRGVLGTMMRLFEHKMQQSMENDFRGHMEDLRETLRGSGQGQGQG